TLMSKYFPKDHTFPEWIQQPFLADMSDAYNIVEEFIALLVDKDCQAKFCTLLLSDLKNCSESPSRWAAPLYEGSSAQHKVLS
ncbi:hypothetical protein SK128_004338, partial [Halocaridina rubra]